MNKISKAMAALSMSVGMLSVEVWGQVAPATMPAVGGAANKVVIPPMTPEQKAIADEIIGEATDVPLIRKAANAYNRDGTPNPDFGKPIAGWVKRHEGFVARGQEPADVVFIGDSITDGWNNQKKLWEERFGKYRPANFGIGGDKTEHVLWRIANGELDRVKPKVVVIMIGTNNSGKSVEEIAKGTTAVVRAVQGKVPEAKVLLLNIFPRAEAADSPVRAKIAAVNEILKKLDDGAGPAGAAGKVTYFELWKQFLAEDGTLTKAIMPDALHPNAKGYVIWADAMCPVLDEMMK